MTPAEAYNAASRFARWTESALRGDPVSWAVFSPCNRYRYILGRSWHVTRPVLSVTMLNPSKADERNPDPTVLRVMARAASEGFGGLVVRNLGAWRAPDPDELLVAVDPVGPHNVEALQLDFGAPHVAAWGRVEKRTMRRLRDGGALAAVAAACTHVFGWTEKPPTVPRHPLFLKTSLRMRPIAIGESVDP